MQIPRIVHQLWRTEDVPTRWRGAVAAVKRYHKGWQYRLWTDAAIDAHVRMRHPAFYPIFAGFNRPIMRADVFRYVLMHDFGGLYCDLDYEFVRPYPYGDEAVLLSWEYQEKFGDDVNQVANFVFASVPGHPFWADVLATLQRDPPHAITPDEVCILTGPGLVTRVYAQRAADYVGVVVTDKPVFSPRRVHGRYERKFYVNSGVTYGYHHGWGSWRERLTLIHLRRKIAKWLGHPTPVNVRPELLERPLGPERSPSGDTPSLDSRGRCLRALRRRLAAAEWRGARDRRPRRARAW